MLFTCTEFLSRVYLEIGRTALIMIVYVVGCNEFQVLKFGMGTCISPLELCSQLQVIWRRSNNRIIIGMSL